MFPHSIVEIDGVVKKELLASFRGEKVGFVKVGPKNLILPYEYKFHTEQLYNFQLRKDDIWVVTFPRSGTTLTQEIVWLINNNFSFKSVKEIPLIERFPFFEFNIMYSDEFLDTVAELNGNDIELMTDIRKTVSPAYIKLNDMTSPRHIKTHLPPSLCPPNLVDTCKVIYVARNPMDAAVSLYHHNKLFLAQDFRGDFEKFWDLFERNLLKYTPYWEHIKEGWELRHHSNVLFLFYEDMLTDLPNNIKKISNFLNKPMTEDQINKLADFVHIDNFRKNFTSANRSFIKGLSNPNAQGFIRRGKIGGNEEFVENIKIRAEKWFKENLARTDIIFPEFKI